MSLKLHGSLLNVSAQNKYEQNLNRSTDHIRLNSFREYSYAAPRTITITSSIRTNTILNILNNSVYSNTTFTTSSNRIMGCIKTSVVRPIRSSDVRQRR